MTTRDRDAYLKIVEKHKIKFDALVAEQDINLQRYEALKLETEKAYSAVMGTQIKIDAAKYQMVLAVCGEKPKKAAL
jgi:hypothetical protein